MKGEDINTLGQNDKFTLGCGDKSKGYSAEEIVASNDAGGNGQTGIALAGKDDPTGAPGYGEELHTGELFQDDIGISNYHAGPLAKDPTFKETANIGFVKEQDVHTCINAHLGMLADYDKLTQGRRARNARYFSLVHFYNAAVMRAQGSSQQAANTPAKDLDKMPLREQDQIDLAIYREAVSKLLNSLHFRRKVIQPKAIDPAGTILYIDLDNYEWTPYQWNKILAAYPFASVYPVSWDSDHALRVVRGDWFVSVASRPPLYHDLLQMPATVADLDKRLDVRSARDIKNLNGASGTVMRGLAHDSPKSRDGRDTVVQRNQGQQWFMWREYNFGGTQGLENVRQNPMGPCYDPKVLAEQGVGSAAYPAACSHPLNDAAKQDLQRKYAFVHSGEQIIFRLPNGFQGYAIADGRGQLLCEMPEKIARDPLTEGKLVNGLSCMGCHFEGLKSFKDDMPRNPRSPGQIYVDGARNSFAMIASYLYPGQSKLDGFLEKDRGNKANGESNLPNPPNDFQQALLQAGVAHVGGTEQLPYDPILATAMAYERELDIFQAAAELGVTVNDYVTAAKQLGDLRTAVRITGDADNETLPRANWIALWPELFFETHDDSSAPIRSYQVEPGKKDGYPSYFKTPDNQVVLGYYANNGQYTDANNNRYNVAAADPRLCAPKPGERNSYQRVSPSYSGTGLPQPSDYVPCEAHEDGKAYYLVDSSNEQKGYYVQVTDYNYQGDYKGQSCNDQAYLPDTRYYVAPKYQQPPVTPTTTYTPPPKVQTYPTTYTTPPAQPWRTNPYSDQGYRQRNRYQQQAQPAPARR